MRGYFLPFLLINILVLGFPIQHSLAQGVQAPETLEEAKFLSLKILEQLPNAVKKVWEEEALPLWQNMWDWARPQVEPWWQKFLSLLGKEVEKRKPGIGEEFQKEKEEMKSELPKVGKSLWERFKELLD